MRAEMPLAYGTRAKLVLSATAMICIFPELLSAQVIGTTDDLLDDVTTFSETNLSLRRYVTLPEGSLGRQETNDIISLTTRPGDGTAFYSSSQDGRVFRISSNGAGQGFAREWFNVNASIGVEQNNTFHGGLRAVAFHPDFNDSSKAGHGKFYASLVAQSRNNAANFIGTSGGSFESVLAEWTYDFASGAVDTSSFRELFRVRNPQLDHPIKQIKFNPLATPDDADYGLLYIGQGDGSILGQLAGTGQVTSSALGKILRINPLEQADQPYTTPGNTFALDNDPNTLAEVYSYGHRNPHHLDFGRDSTGRHHLIVAEPGQDNIDEVNLIEINTAQGGERNGLNYGWSLREGTFVKIPDALRYGVRPSGGGDGSAALLPLDDDGLELVYPALQLDHNDPTDGNRFGVSGGPVVDGRYYYSVFAGNNVRPGGQIYSASLEDLASQKTSFDASAGEDVSDLTWIDDHVQHRLDYDHDNNPQTPALRFDDLAQVIGFDTSSTQFRSDIRFGATSNGELLLSSKRNGAIYLVADDFSREVSLMVDLATGDAVINNESDEVFEIDAYGVTSGSGSIDALAWNSFETQGVDDGDWVASPASSQAIGELQQFGTTSLSRDASYALGSIFRGGEQDLSLSFLLDGAHATSTVAATFILAGDYNGDGLVDAADYAVWRDALQTGTPLANDLTPGTVAEEDYQVWAQNFGVTLASLTAGTAAVPEPNVCGLLVLALLVLSLHGRPASLRVESVVMRGRRSAYARVSVPFLMLCLLVARTEAQVLFIDFGEGAGDYTGAESPAHAFGLSPQFGLWNTIDSVMLNADPNGRISDLWFADNTPANGVTLAVREGGLVDFNQPTPSGTVLEDTQRGATSAAIYNTELMRDWLFSRGDDNLYVQVSGLDPGEYEVFALVREFDQPGRTYSADIGVDNDGIALFGDFGPVHAGTAGAPASWVQGANYFSEIVTLESAADSIVVSIDPTNAAFATLQGLQIVSASQPNPCSDYDTCFGLVSQNLFQTVSDGLLSGDFDNSGVVDFADFRVVKSTFLNTSAAVQTTSVPEPSALLAVLVASLASVAVRRR